MNEYGLLKDARRAGEGAGAGTVGDFDDYTIYQEGPLNEYGVLKAQR